MFLWSVCECVFVCAHVRASVCVCVRAASVCECACVCERGMGGSVCLCVCERERVCV